VKSLEFRTFKPDKTTRIDQHDCHAMSRKGCLTRILFAATPCECICYDQTDAEYRPGDRQPQGGEQSLDPSLRFEVAPRHGFCFRLQSCDLMGTRGPDRRLRAARVPLELVTPLKLACADPTKQPLVGKGCRARISHRVARSVAVNPPVGSGIDFELQLVG